MGLGDCLGFLQKRKAATIPAWSHQGAGALPLNVSFQATSCVFLLSFGGAEAPFPAHCSHLLAWARWAALLAPFRGEARTRMALQVPESTDIGLAFHLRPSEAAWAAPLPGSPLHTTATVCVWEQCRSFRTATGREKARCVSARDREDGGPSACCSGCTRTGRTADRRLCGHDFCFLLWDGVGPSPPSPCLSLSRRIEVVTWRQ